MQQRCVCSPTAPLTLERRGRDVLLHVAAQQGQHVANVGEHHVCVIHWQMEEGAAQTEMGAATQTDRTEDGPST